MQAPVFVLLLMLTLGLCLFLSYLGFPLYFYDACGISVGYAFFAVFVVP